jgi:signal transduction histidine kinase
VALPTLVAVVVSAVAVGLDVAAPAASWGRELAPGSVWIHGVMAVCFALLCSVLLAGRRWGWAAVVGVYAVCALTAGLLRGWVHLSVTTPVEPASASAAGLVALLWVLKITNLVPLTFVCIAVVVFPTGRLPQGRWRVVTIASYAITVPGILVTALGPNTLGFSPQPGSAADGSVLREPHVLGASFLGPWIDTVALLVVPLSVAALVVGQLSVPVLRIRESVGTERERLYWLLWSAVAIALTSTIDIIVRGGTLDGWLVGLGCALVATAMAVALVDQHTVSGETVLAHTVVYGGLGVLVLGLDLAFLSALSAVLGDSLAQREVVLAVLVCSAVFYGPLRAALWRVARRWLLGQRDDPYDVVAGLAAGLERAEEGSEQLSAVARAVAQAFGVSFVAVEVDRAAGARLAATLGTRPRETRALPISYRGATVGRLVLPARGLRTQLDRRDERLLGDLVRQAAAAARTSQLADELQTNREQLVLAREEERRRIRRDLHDGLGPSLGGAVFLLDSARLLVDRDPDGAETQLEATETHLRGVMDDVRRLVSDLRPPALDALGLVGALRQQGELVAGVEVHLDAPDPHALTALPAAVEVAAYRIVGEALTNVARHAAASRCAIRLEVVADAPDQPALRVEVADDGRGIPAERQAGVGLLSLRERADELGGRTEITCPAGGGTLVRAWLPIPAVVAAPTPVPAPTPPLEELVS